MLYSEFQAVVEDALGSAYGRSLLVDLYVPALGGTAAEAIEGGVDPQVVWEALVAECDLDADLVWLHRADPPERAARRKMTRTGVRYRVAPEAFAR